MSPVWPTPLEVQLLLACFAPEADAGAALERCLDGWTGAVAEGGRLLPLLYRRWPAVENELIELGRRAYLATWNRNRDSLARLAGLGGRFREEGIRWMALKGTALTVRQYADLGLRPMADLDLLIPAEDLDRALRLLNRWGFSAEENAAPDAILRQARVRHAWQFLADPDWNFDLHWRPVNRCYAPEVTRLFWEGAEMVRFGGLDIPVPSPSDQLFLACVHGLQWDWTSKTRWIADALKLLGDTMNWERICHLAESAAMSFRLGNGLLFLRDRLRAPIPIDLPERLMRSAPEWERREYRLLMKPCPLGVFDSIAWHAYHLRRIRPYDDDWRQAPLPIAWTQYLGTFLDARGMRNLWMKLRPQIRLRLER